ncbi:MAG TPA: ABC transporter permease, partial [Thermodesulfobacteriota bacterium]|nr:ABC transporter permease [Thermodesulfobacteriota bacterium]
MEMMEPETERGKKIRAFLRNKTSIVGLGLIVVITLIAVFASYIAPYDVRAQNLAERLLKPGWPHLLGTDDFGRDNLSRAILGTRISLAVGVISVLIAVFLGMMVGMIAGYFGGKFDVLVVGIVDILMAFPTILLSLTLLFILGPGLSTLIIAIAFSFFPRFIRIARASTLSVKEEKYIEGARLVGRGDWGILIFHILPNISGPIIVIGT